MSCFQLLGFPFIAQRERVRKITNLEQQTDCLIMTIVILSYFIVVEYGEQIRIERFVRRHFSLFLYDTVYCKLTKVSCTLRVRNDRKDLNIRIQKIVLR